MMVPNQTVRAFIAAPTSKNWEEVMRVVAPFDASQAYAHGTLVSVVNQLFRIERAPRGMRARRFNRKAKHFNRSSMALDHFKIYAEQHRPRVIASVPDSR